MKARPSISHSPSGSNSLVTPSFCSATLKALWRLWVGLDLFRLLNSTRSGLREEDGESESAKERGDSETAKENEEERHWADGFLLCVFTFQSWWEWFWPFISPYRCLCMRALKAMPSFQLVVKLVMLTLGYLREKKQPGGGHWPRSSCFKSMPAICSSTQVLPTTYFFEFTPEQMTCFTQKRSILLLFADDVVFNLVVWNLELWQDLWPTLRGTLLIPFLDKGRNSKSIPFSCLYGKLASQEPVSLS